MKNLIFSLLFVFWLLPNISFGEAISPEDILNYTKDTSPSTNEQLQQQTINPGLQDFLNKINSIKQNEPVIINGKSYTLNEEDQSMLDFKENESAPDYTNRINTENAIRSSQGKPLLPSPTISTTQIPSNTNLPQPSLNETSRPPIEDPSTWMSPEVKTSSNINVLDTLIPQSGSGLNYYIKNQPLSNILNQLFFVGLIIAVIGAIVMIIRGGIEYMTIDAITSKESGKRRVQAALGGLLLAFSSILILNTINPNITSLSIVFKKMEKVETVGVDALESAARAGLNQNNSINQAITPTTEGYMVTPGRVAIDTDGIGEPPFLDKTRQNQTSLAGLNANTDNFIVVPIGSEIPLKTKVKMYNKDTGITAWGIVGDRGPTKNGYGEISLHAAKELGVWTDGMGDSAKQHSITYTFYTNEK